MLTDEEGCLGLGHDRLGNGILMKYSAGAWTTAYDEAPDVIWDIEMPGSDRGWAVGYRTGDAHADYHAAWHPGGLSAAAISPRNRQPD